MSPLRKLALLAGLGLAATSFAYAPPVQASSFVSVRIGIAPPPPRWEAVPVARVGYVWAPGYWRWGGASYVWVGGRWYPGRSGYSYVAPRWERYNGGWRMHAAYWNPRPHYVHPRRVYHRAYRRGYRHAEHREHRVERHAYRNGTRHASGLTVRYADSHHDNRGHSRGHGHHGR